MWAQVRTAVLMLVAMTLVTGLAYPLVITGVAQLVFHKQANGTLLIRDGRPIGSELIGQPFDDPGYFWSRPSATASYPYNGGASGGSNLATTNPAQLQTIRLRVSKLRAADPGNTAPVPIDLVTASGSGLDPHISVSAAEYQVARVARARGMSTESVAQLVAEHSQRPQVGVLGQPRVNVLMLNRTLDDAQRVIAHNRPGS